MALRHLYYSVPAKAGREFQVHVTIPEMQGCSVTNMVSVSSRLIREGILTIFILLQIHRMFMGHKKHILEGAYIGVCGLRW